MQYFRHSLDFEKFPRHFLSDSQGIGPSRRAVSHRSALNGERLNSAAVDLASCYSITKKQLKMDG